MNRGLYILLVVVFTFFVCGNCQEYFPFVANISPPVDTVVVGFEGPSNVSFNCDQFNSNTGNVTQTTTIWALRFPDKPNSLIIFNPVNYPEFAISGTLRGMPLPFPTFRNKLTIVELTERLDNVQLSCGQGGVWELGIWTLQVRHDCTTGDVRLVDGLKEREGRVEVCVDGIWGTVCNSGEDTSRAVCTKLGYPKEGAVISDFGQGRTITPVYNCTSHENLLNCVRSTFDHSTDIGVVCPTYQEAVVYLRNECSREKPTMIAAMNPCPNVTNGSCDCNKECDTSPHPSTDGISTVPCRCNINVTTTLPVDKDSTTMTNKQVCNSTIVVAAVTCLLVAIIIAMVIGWIYTCIVLTRRSSNRIRTNNSDNSDAENSQNYRKIDLADKVQEHLLDNPLYEGATPHTCQRELTHQRPVHLLDNPIYEGADETALHEGEDGLIDNPIYGGAEKPRLVADRDYNEGTGHKEEVMYATTEDETRFLDNPIYGNSERGSMIDGYGSSGPAQQATHAIV